MLVVCGGSFCILPGLFWYYGVISTLLCPDSSVINVFQHTERRICPNELIWKKMAEQNYGARKNGRVMAPWTIGMADGRNRDTINHFLLVYMHNYS